MWKCVPHRLELVNHIGKEILVLDRVPAGIGSEHIVGVRTSVTCVDVSVLSMK